MKIRTRALNKNETFCCSKNDVKMFFSKCDITINFGRYGSRNFETDPRFYRGPKLKGKIIASLGMLNASTIMENAILSFFVIKEEDYSDKLRKEFVIQILPLIYEKYSSHTNNKLEKTNGAFVLRVELFNNQFVLHEGIEN